MKNACYIQDAIYKISIAFSCCLPATPVLAQPPEATGLEQQFVQYQLNAFQEKLFVHTNKTFYLAGETAWFKIYAVDACLHQPACISSIANVELISKDQRPVWQARIALDS
ncbi:MAG TPA: hypothetical protein VLD19_13270, partial [Chitinophagaceae bacterium]|nr:hypothetical protein [Chitinophagaceae bacterium]